MGKRIINYVQILISQQVPQIAQIITPSGQIQQVQIANLSQLQNLQVR